MIAWAGHGEDQILRRIFTKGEPGTFLDIGSAHPKFGSVTYSLYRLGWRGVAIEPRKSLAKQWQKIRPDDFLITSALTKNGESGFLANDGYRTKFVVDDERAMNRCFIKSESISIAKLRVLTEEYVTLTPELIKIDIEGDEYSIVDGLLEQGYRPEIWIVEVVDQFNHEHIRREPQGNLESLMQSFNYVMKLMDGVNEWYVKECSPSLNRNIWAPAYPGVEDFIPFHLTTNYRIRNYIHFKRTRILKRIRKKPKNT